MLLDIDVHSPSPTRKRQELSRNIAIGVGWAALALGLAHVVAPRTIVHVIGVRQRARTRSLVRMLGAGVLVGGVAALGASYGVKAVSTPVGGRSIARAVTIARPPTDVHAFLLGVLHGPTHLLHFGREHRELADAGATNVTAGVENVFDETPTLHWRVSPDAGFEGEASIEVRVAPGDRGTELVARMRWDAPTVASALAVRKLFGKLPELELAQGLARLKQVLETGSVTRSDASIHRGMHAARPASAGQETST